MRVKLFSVFNSKVLSLFVFSLLLFARVPETRAADSSARFSENYYARHSQEFVATPQLQGYVDFWKLIFSKYGEKQQVFHFRDKPWVIYSVLDYSKYAAKYSGREYERRRSRAAEQQESKIRSTLQHLAGGKEPRNAFERRIERMFDALEGDTKRHYRHALEEKQIRSQTGVRERFAKGVARSHRYLHAMEQIFQGEGLPIELTRLPLIESSFDYTARSSVGAAGIWQFMTATGRAYLRINNYVDERLDPISATRAAAKYLSHAYKRLGSWPLAVTSYNHGITGVLRAVNQSGSRDLYTIIKNYKSGSFGFASSNFFVELIAAIEIERDPQKYFPGLEFEKPLYFDEVQLGRSMTFGALLQASGMEREEFIEYNLAFLKPTIQGRASVPARFLMKVRHGTGQAVVRRLGHGKVYSLDGGSVVYSEDLSEIKKTDNWRQYKVQRGDTIGGIARKFSVSSQGLMDANGIKDARRVKLGATLKIPPAHGFSAVPTARATVPQKKTSSPTTAGTYTVKSGDNLGGIAKKNGISLAKLKTLNPGIKTTIRPGQKIRIR